MEMVEIIAPISIPALIKPEIDPVRDISCPHLTPLGKKIMVKSQKMAFLGLLL